MGDETKKTAKRKPKAQPMDPEFRRLYMAKLQEVNDLVERMRAWVWLDMSDPSDHSELADEAIDVLVRLGVERRERDYNNESNPAGLPE